MADGVQRFSDFREPWLSPFSGIGICSGRSSSEKRFLVQANSLAHWESAVYSASVVDSATVSCRLALHETVDPSS
ncbi:Uncharacterized protein HZ326_28399 [Fusarium oxysporum f. sp. albedinis]|nr:Uncharacterized protein HZ326_28399 [Fusarium oxysporum f. sp. albedinis]